MFHNSCDPKFSNKPYKSSFIFSVKRYGFCTKYFHCDFVGCLDESGIIFGRLRIFYLVGNSCGTSIYNFTNMVGVQKCTKITMGERSKFLDCSNFCILENERCVQHQDIQEGGNEYLIHFFLVAGCLYPF